MKSYLKLEYQYAQNHQNPPEVFLRAKPIMGESKIVYIILLNKSSIGPKSSWKQIHSNISRTICSSLAVWAWGPGLALCRWEDRLWAVGCHEGAIAGMPKNHRFQCAKPIGLQYVSRLSHGHPWLGWVGTPWLGKPLSEEFLRGAFQEDWTLQSDFAMTLTWKSVSYLCILNWQNLSHWNYLFI